jgi:putative transposase
MIANHKLSAAILDCGFYEFRRQLTYKSEMYGTKVELVDRWFPSSKTCSNCGHIQSMPLKERVFNCDCCNLLINRDLNAAINLSRCSEKVRLAWSEVTPVDKKEPAPLVEAGSEHRICRR